MTKDPKSIHLYEYACYHSPSSCAYGSSFVSLDEAKRGIKDWLNSLSDIDIKDSATITITDLGFYDDPNLL